MGALVVYESMYGNTRAVAEAVAEGLRTVMPTEVVEVGQAPELESLETDLLVVGAPTHAFGLSRPETRRDAYERAGHPVISEATGVREWLGAAYSVREHLPVASFDTHVKAPFPGSAHASVAKRIARLGGEPVGRGQSFRVHGYEGPLLDGEIERARTWGAELGRLVAGDRVA
ncbi:flavodoxin family protein [Georgenia daeguensis]